MSNSKVENMIDSLIEMTADPDMPIKCIEAIDLAIQSLVDNTDVEKSYYNDLDTEEKDEMIFMEMLFSNLLRNSIALA
jgi:hypothetical protein